jgi:hypothetical protein
MTVCYRSALSWYKLGIGYDWPTVLMDVALGSMLVSRNFATNFSILYGGVLM